MGGSSSSTTEQSQTSYPQWTQNAQQDTYQTGTGMLENFLRNPQYQVAGFSSDTKKGMDFARDTARQVYEAPSLSAPAAGGNLTTTMGQAASMSPASMTPASMRGAQVTGGEINSFMNPYLQVVLDPTIANMNRARNTTDAQIGAKYAAQGGLGGSGAAIARGQNNRAFGEQVATTAATLMAQGYDKATATALANAQMRQQTEMTNTGYAQDAAKTNATFGQQAGLTNAGFDQQTNLANQSADNTMKALGLDYGLKSTQVNDQLRTTETARQLSALQQILQGGQMQEGKAQQALDIPWTALQRLMALTPQQMNSQTFKQGESEKQESAASTFGSIASGLGSLGIKFSDARMKTDIRMIGSLPNGLGVYDYAWRANGKREIGLIAQEVQRARPDAVIEAPNGMLMVDYGKAVGGA
jgi:hypothetical protein